MEEVSSATEGDWLGSCSHPVLKSAYIARHNKALCLIQKTLSTTAPAAWYTILDASAADRLPPGVSGNRLPSWLLPSLPSSTLSLLRPDMLVIQGLSLSSSRLITAQLTAHDPTTLTTLALLKASCLHTLSILLSCPIPVMNSTTRPSRKKCHNTTTSSALSLQKVGRLPLPLSRLPTDTPAVESSPLHPSPCPGPTTTPISCLCPHRTSPFLSTVRPHTPIHTLLHHPQKYTHPIGCFVSPT